MKNTARNISALLAIMLSAASCTLSKSQWLDIDHFTDIDGSKSFVPFSAETITVDGNSVLDCTLPGGDTVEEALNGETDTKTTNTNGSSVIRAMISRMERNKIISYSGSYWSSDQHGNPIRISGRVILPSDGKVSRIMLVSHYTIGSTAEAPSNEVTIESMYAAKGLAVLQSDYIGYGITADKVHPYLCADVTAGNVLDMYYAALPFLKGLGCEPEFDDIFLLGFSQGGAVTMSVAQKIEMEDPWIKIRLIMAGGGPYDICATYDTLMDNDYTDYPCAIPMIIQGMDHGNDLHLNYSDFFLPRMCENLDEWINSKRHTMGEITKLIGSKQISSIMTREAMDKVGDKMTDLYRSMVDNSVVNSDMPESPIYLFHSLDDKVVPFINAYNIMQKMDLQESNVKYNFGHYGSHQMATLRFMLACMDLLKENGDI